MTVANADKIRTPPPWVRGLYPWGRYWAKMIDLYLFGLVFGVTFPAVVRSITAETGTLGWIALTAMVYPLVEGLAICAFGTTLGKSVFQISVLREDGSRLSLGQSVRRSYGAWLHGAWLGAPLIGLVAMMNAYRDYSTDRVTRWDLRAEVVGQFELGPRARGERRLSWRHGPDAQAPPRS